MLETVSNCARQEMRRARKRYVCRACGQMIEPGDHHWCRYYGGGLGALKFPDRLCLRCREAVTWRE